MRNLPVKLLFLLLFLSMKGKTESVLPANPSYFVQNKGQWKPELLFRNTTSALDLHIEKQAIRYYFFAPDAFPDVFHHPKIQATKSKGHAISFELIGANEPEPAHFLAESEYLNFLQSNNPKQWAFGVPLTRNLFLPKVYPGIGLRFQQDEVGNMKYEWICEAGSDPSQIQLEIRGANSINLEYGNLFVAHSFGYLKEKKPMAYQIIGNEKIQISCNFHLEGNKLSYKMGKDFNPNLPLVIDPDLVFLTYSGSTADNFGCTATPGENGTMYSGGVVTGPYASVPDGRFPATAGAFQITYAGGGISEGEALREFPCDMAISKYSADGTKLLWATYIGGSNNEVPHSLVVDQNNNLLIMGTTYSANFPVKAESFDTSHNGRMDLVVMKFSSDGLRLAGATFVGGTDNDGINTNGQTNYFFADSYRGDIICDPSGKVFVASVTHSSNFPIRNNAIQNSLSGFQDGVLFQFDSTLSQLEKSTYLGGNGVDAFYSLDFDKSGEIFISGGTTSSNFPGIPNNAVQPNLSGNTDGIILHIKSDLSTIISGTYWGTAEYDQILSLDIDPNNQLVVVGQSLGKMPVSQGVFSNPGSHQFISCFDNNLSTQIWSTVFGSGRNAIDVTVNAFLVDDCGKIYISCWGGPTSNFSNSSTVNLPTTSNAYQTTTDGKDFYLVCLEKDARELLYATFLGGNSPSGTGDHVDGGTSRFDKKGIVYQSICASCPDGSASFLSDMKTTPDAYSPKNPSPRCSNAALKFDFQIRNAAFEFELDTCEAMFSFNPTVKNASSFLWKFPDGTRSTEKNPSWKMKKEYEKDSVWLVVSPGTSCSDSTYKILQLPDSAGVPKLPNIFSPNSDGINDFYRMSGLLSQCNELEVEIYNRWGQEIFKDKTTYFAWDGKDQLGNEMAEGVYFVLLKTKRITEETFKEWRTTVTLIR